MNNVGFLRTSDNFNDIQINSNTLEKENYIENLIVKAVIGCAISVHKEIGAGATNNTYLECLCYELSEKGIEFERDIFIPVFYKNLVVPTGYCVDLLVEGRVIVDLKTVDQIQPEFIIHMLNKLTGLKKKLGVIINFNSKFIKGDAIKRIINSHV